MRENLSPEEYIRQNCQEINHCNQRGGRMLSIIDLLQADTVSMKMAAFLLSVIRKGSSFLVGALPGGAGKTTVMGALLNLIPTQTLIRSIANQSVLTSGLTQAETKDCYVAHEISPGSYYAYIWGNDAADFFALQHLGHMVVSNLHADTLEQAYYQLCIQNPVLPSDFHALEIKLFLRVFDANVRRQFRVVQIFETSPLGVNRLLFKWDPLSGYLQSQKSGLVSQKEQAECQEIVQLLKQDKIHRIEAVRRYLVEKGIV